MIALDALGGQNSAYVIDMMRTRRVVVHVTRDAMTPAALASSVWNCDIIRFEWTRSLYVNRFNVKYYLLTHCK
jgi:hypothetical protein